MDGFTFVHCADLHLDSPFEGMHVVEPDVAAVLRNATFEAFDNVIDLAVRERADFLIIAGDVYDGVDRSLRAQLRFRDGLQRAVENGIQCFVAHGNHDPLSGWEAQLIMPDGVCRFRDRVERFTVKRGKEVVAHVYGVSYRDRDVQENLASQFQRDPGAPFAIGVLHCNVGGDPSHDNYAPCTLDDLVSRGLDYWALGHIHARRILREQGPCIVYPGNTQGRSVRELGARGCYLVRVDSAGRVRPEFVPADVVRWYTGEVDIGSLDTMDDLLEALQLACEDARTRAEGRAAVLRLRVVGRGDLHGGLRRVDVDRDLATPLRQREMERSDFVWVESVWVETRRPIDVARRRAVEDFVGEFLRTVEKVRRTGDPYAVLRTMLASRPEHRLIYEQLEGLSEADLLAILDEAESLGLDQLLREGD